MVDKFADIADRDRETDTDALERIPPREFDPAPLDAYDGAVPSAERPSHAERLAAFDDDLAALREEYEPFLQELQPAPTVERPRTPLSTFDFRYETDADAADFDRVLDGDGEWERVEIPEYRGPEGQWTGFYRTTFDYGDPERDRVYLRFEGADYVARVYLNGRCLGSHEGVFAPFEFDATGPIRAGENTLVVEIENEYPMNGPNPTASDLEGDKIHACNSPGWDDPHGGWQVCPSGAGLYHEVVVEERAAVHATDVFARPSLGAGAVEAWIEIENATDDRADVSLDVDVHPQNFAGEAVDGGTHAVDPAGLGRNDYRLPVEMGDYRTWSPDEPWLYTLHVDVLIDGAVVDSAETQFGMRSFEFDRDTDPKGEPRLNGDPIRLRGANTMGHLQRCVMAGNEDQLIDDLLIGKLANQNYFRLTQRAIQSEVYETADKLGMLLQSDLPLFGTLRRTQVPEAIRQAEEMERHVRGHPSAIQSTFINEPHDTTGGEEHRALSRPELEDFMDAATDVVRTSNPDRAIKRVEGDYDPPTRTGLSDFHCYSTWYTNHALPVGELHAGWLPEIDPEWLTASGEYGVEGLDNLDLMLEAYPDEWLPDDLDDPWSPNEIYMSQTFGMHGDWFDEQETITDWIEAGQRHQARSARLMTDAFRRRADRVTMSAIHLLIDAWPDGWQKAIVDAHRRPKRAFFAYRDANEPVRVHLRTDRTAYRAGESLDVEAWLLNDEPDRLDGYRIEAALRVDGEQVGAVARDGVSLDPVSGEYEGHVAIDCPAVDERTSAAVDAVLYDDGGEIVNRERQEIDLFPAPDPLDVAVATVGDAATDLTDALGVDPVTIDGGAPDAIVVGGDAPVDDRVLDAVADGATALLLRRGEGEWSVGGRAVEVVDHHGLTFVARSDDAPETADFVDGDFGFRYDATDDRIGFVADSYLSGDDVEPVLHTFPEKAPVGGMAEYEAERKERAPVVGRIGHGDGRICCSELFTSGRVGHDPVIDAFVRGLLAAAAD